MSEYKAIEETFINKRVTFLGANESQISWGGNDDPNKVLTVGEKYDIESVDVHSWHTKITLVGFEGVFNSSSFEVAE